MASRTVLGRSGISGGLPTILPNLKRVNFDLFYIFSRICPLSDTYGICRRNFSLESVISAPFFLVFFIPPP